MVPPRIESSGQKEAPARCQEGHATVRKNRMTQDPPTGRARGDHKAARWGNTMDRRLLDAYLSTEFSVEEVPNPFLLRVGSCSSALLALHAECGVTCSAFLTAYNPGSRPHSDDWNRAAQERVEAELTQGGFALRRGMGRDPSGAWPGEPSVLALGIPRDEAERIGRRYGQNAILWSDVDAVPQLLVLVHGD